MLEQWGSQSLGLVWTQVTHLRSWAITFASDNALALCVIYVCFPGRAIMSLIKFIAKTYRSRA